MFKAGSTFLNSLQHGKCFFFLPNCGLLYQTLLNHTTIYHKNKQFTGIITDEYSPPSPSALSIVQQVNSVLEEESSHGPVILRIKRAAAKEKNTCQLFIQTDHLFFRYYGTREAVIAQV